MIRHTYVLRNLRRVHSTPSSATPATEQQKEHRTPSKKMRMMVSGKTTKSFNCSHNPNKDRINNIVCSAVRGQNLDNGNTNALILDGINMRTTKYLTSIGIIPNNITSVESDRSTHAKHLKGGIHSMHGNLWTGVAAHKNPYSPYDVLWLDTTNTAQTVSMGLSNLFRNGYVSNSCVLAITVTKRGNVRGMKHTHELANLKKKIELVANRAGVSTNLFASRSDGRVNTVVYTIVRI